MELQRAVLVGGLGAALTLAAIGSLTPSTHNATAVAQVVQATTSLKDAQGNAVGMVSFTQQGSKMLVQAEVMNLPPGFHGFHVHATGDCDPTTNFMSAGGHYQQPGMSHSHSDHSGDMPSLYVNADGTGMLQLTTDRFSLEDLFVGGQRALIVHADKDNFAHIPARYGVTPDETTLNTGDAGGRLACGVLARN